MTASTSSTGDDLAAEAFAAWADTVLQTPAFADAVRDIVAASIAVDLAVFDARMRALETGETEGCSTVDGSSFFEPFDPQNPKDSPVGESGGSGAGGGWGGRAFLPGIRGRRIGLAAGLVAAAVGFTIANSFGTIAQALPVNAERVDFVETLATDEPTTTTIDLAPVAVSVGRIHPVPPRTRTTTTETTKR